jgi:hypothetical protein
MQPVATDHHDSDVTRAHFAVDRFDEVFAWFDLIDIDEDLVFATSQIKLPVVCRAAFEATGKDSRVAPSQSHHR